MQHARLNTRSYFTGAPAKGLPLSEHVTTRRRILVIGPKWIGDMVMAQSLFKALKRQAPDCMLDVVGPVWASELLGRMPEVDHIIIADVAHGELGLGKRWQLGRQLRRRGYDQAYAMSRSLKSALIPWFAGIPRRTGYLGEYRYGIVNDVRTLDTTTLQQKAQHYVALSLAPNAPPVAAEIIEQPRLMFNQYNRDALIARHELSLQRPIVALAPGAAHGPAKRWPASNFAELAKALVARGFQCWIFGSSADTATGQEIAAAAPEHCFNFCAETSLGDAVDLLSLAQTAVGNDTGLMHIAAARVPHVVGLYGSTHPDYAPPLCEQPVQLWLNLPCSPCKAKHCPLKHTLCLRGIPVADVLRACLSADDYDIPSRYNPA